MDRSKEAVSLFNKWAQHYLDKYWDVSQYAGPLDFFCQELKRKTRRYWNLPADREMLLLMC